MLHLESYAGSVLLLLLGQWHDGKRSPQPPKTLLLSAVPLVAPFDVVLPSSAVMIYISLPCYPPPQS